MTASIMWAAARLRRFARSAVALGLLLGAAGGLVIAVASGAGRAESAYTRLLASTDAPDGYIFLGGSADRLERRVEHLPQVRQAAYAMGLAPPNTEFTPVVLTDPRYGTELSRFKFLSGRRPARADEAMVDYTLARSRHLGVGDRLPMAEPTTGTAVSLKVVGVVADTRAFPPLAYALQQAIYLDSSFLATPAGRRWASASGEAQMVAVRLRGGVRDFGSFLRDVESLAGGPVGADSRETLTAPTQRSMHLQSLALWLTAGFGGLVVAGVMSQLLLRQLADQGSAVPALRSLGMTTGELVTADLLWAAAVSAVAAASALPVAWLASPLFPFGTARVADPHPGFVFDWTTSVLGAAILVATVVVITALAAWTLGRRRPARAGNAGSGFISLKRLPVVVATGVRLALRAGRGRSAVPVRTTIGATAVAIGGVIVASTFAASLGHLLSTPKLYGTTYDADIEMNADFGDVNAVVPGLLADRDVAAIAVAGTGIPMRSGAVSFGGELLQEVKGSILPTVVSGRLPEAPDEIVLGTRTMRSLHTAIGRTIEVAVTGVTGQMPFRVVGTGVLATLTDSEGLGKGAVVSTTALDRLLANAPPGFRPPPPGDVFIRFEPGVSTPKAISSLTDRLGGIRKVLVTAPTQPTDVADFGQVRNLPQVLAGLLSCLAAATVAYMLVTAIPRRRREVAILKTLGFVPAQVSAAIAWQATTVATLAMVIGIPLGVIGGRALWSAVAGEVGVVVEPVVPWLAIAVVVPAALVVANLLSAGPAVLAARIPPHRPLRDE